MGPVVRMSFANAGHRRPGFDEAGALRAALAQAAQDLSALAARTDEQAAEFLEFQLALIDDGAVIGPALGRAADGVAADTAWRDAMDKLIADYGANPSEYIRARSLDVADLRERVLNMLQGRAVAVAPPAGAIIVADDLPPSRREKYDQSGRNSKVLVKKLAKAPAN